MPSRPQARPHPAQQSLPMPPQEPAAAQVHAELLRIWQARPHLHRTWPSVPELLADPDRAKRLATCARQALLARQRMKRT